MGGAVKGPTPLVLLGLHLGLEAALGLSEDDPAVQVVPAPTPLMPHFQVLFLDPVKVAQQLRVVDAGGLSLLGPGGCGHTVSGDGDGQGSQSVK